MYESSLEPLIDVDDAKTQLNISLDNHTDDDEIAAFILAATQVINWMAGQSSAESGLTDWITPNWGTPGPNLGVYGSGYVSVTLSRTPVLSVESIQPQFYQVAAVDLTNTSIDGESGTIWIPTTQLFLGPCLVTYTAGRIVRPAVLELACRFLVEDLWATQRGAATTGNGPMSGGGQEMETIPGIGMVSSRVMNLIRLTPYHSAPGFA